tara:strand:- start:1099 stop:1833 length:735 start_codon:yes stop_codon:yes gene_type:complete
MITAYESLDGNWIGASNPETIINLSIQNDNFVGHEIDYKTSQMKEEPLFTVNLSKKISQSSDGASELVLVREDTLINSDGQILYRDYKNKQNKMMCMTNWSSKIPQSMLKRLDELRITAARHCLECTQEACSMKIWPEGNEKEALLCKRIFCQPTGTVKKNIFGELDKFPSGKSTALFHYSINEEGEIKDLKIQEVIGSMDEKQASLYLNLMLKSHKYKELIIENQKFGITNLRGVINWKLDKR